MKIKINNRLIGDGYPVFIVAELSANHCRDFKIAVNTIRAVKRCGADAVKLQTYTPDTITMNSTGRYFKIDGGTPWDGKTLYQLYKEAYTPWEWQPKLKKIAEDLGLILFSSPFDKTAVDFLENMGVPAYKIASLEITDIPLIEYVASKRKPVIISTGVASISDIKEAVNACRKMGNDQISLLKCTSAYPAPLNELNLITIQDLKARFKTITGLSDHSSGIFVPAASVALGAKIIEKHIILNRKQGGPDAGFSLEPQEFKAMVSAVRDTEKAIGKVSYVLTKRSKVSKKFARSLFVTKDIQAGEFLSENNIRSIRPGYGLAPKYFKEILGKKAKKGLRAGTPLSFNMVA